jgi:hypothetical protein
VFMDSQCPLSHTDEIRSIISSYLQLSHCKRRRLTALPSPPNRRSRGLRVHKFAMSLYPSKRPIAALPRSDAWGQKATFCTAEKQRTFLITSRCAATQRPVIAGSNTQLTTPPPEVDLPQRAVRALSNPKGGIQ